MPIDSIHTLQQILPDRAQRLPRMIVVDAHVCGGPARVILGGDLIPNISGKTAFEKMKNIEEHHDWIRKIVLNEPRGYPAGCANIVFPSTHPDCLFSYVIMEQAKVYPPMSGHNTMAVATVLLETGLIPIKEPVTRFNLEAPAGPIAITAEVEAGKIKSIELLNVPAFVFHLGKEIDVPTLGKVKVDVAYGGMIYALADVEPLGIALVPEEGKTLVRVGELIKAAAREQLPVVHPENPQIRDVCIVVLRGKAHSAGATARNTVVMSTGELKWDDESTWTGALDRSPCGTGTCATMAVKHARGDLPLNTPFHHENILGTQFEGRLLEETKVGEYTAVVTTVKGQGYLIGISEIVMDPKDPFPEGYQVGDIW
ncbi:hypothetical protein CYMTET_48324 [Cymbomonas tetramitiformis]|uniref:Proline racemase n=1 Tax=Cymbomonas tetramitiformis TaxID=36881 RepID=A0AAE0BU46_9CHLO|nr:hypothetical protein CYMTET_48324 [Cymbomonas tetramitiformis]